MNKQSQSKAHQAIKRNKSQPTALKRSKIRTILKRKIQYRNKKGLKRGVEEEEESQKFKES